MHQMGYLLFISCRDEGIWDGKLCILKTRNEFLLKGESLGTRVYFPPRKNNTQKILDFTTARNLLFNEVKAFNVRRKSKNKLKS